MAWACQPSSDRGRELSENLPRNSKDKQIERGLERAEHAQGPEFHTQHVLKEAMWMDGPAYLGGVEVADASSGRVSFPLYLGTIVQKKVVPPGKRTERSHGSLLVTMLNS